MLELNAILKGALFKDNQIEVDEKVQKLERLLKVAKAREE